MALGSYTAMLLGRTHQVGLLGEVAPLKVEPQCWYLSLTQSFSEIQEWRGTPGRWAFGSCDFFCP